VLFACWIIIGRDVEGLAKVFFADVTFLDEDAVGFDDATGSEKMVSLFSCGE
jgi:hypothetical protein